MKTGAIGIYYLDYCDAPYPRSKRKMIIGYTRQGLLNRIKETNIPDDWFCWFQECRTPGYLVEGKLPIVVEWIEKHMPDKLGGPLR